MHASSPLPYCMPIKGSDVYNIGLSGGSLVYLCLINMYCINMSSGCDVTGFG